MLRYPPTPPRLSRLSFLVSCQQLRLQISAWLPQDTSRALVHSRSRAAGLQWQVTHQLPRQLAGKCAPAYTNIWCIYGLRCLILLHCLNGLPLSSSLDCLLAFLKLLDSSLMSFMLLLLGCVCCLAGACHTHLQILLGISCYAGQAAAPSLS